MTQASYALTRKKTSQNHLRHNKKIEIPRALNLEVFELKHDCPDFMEAKKYLKFRKEYLSWNAAELLSRLRLLCVEARKNLYEVCAVFDELESKIFEK